MKVPFSAILYVSILALLAVASIGAAVWQAEFLGVEEIPLVLLAEETDADFRQEDQGNGPIQPDDHLHRPGWDIVGLGPNHHRREDNDAYHEQLETLPAAKFEKFGL